MPDRKEVVVLMWEDHFRNATVMLPILRNAGGEFTAFTQDAGHLREIMDWIDQLYLGEFCQKCQRRSVCPDPIA